MSQLIKAPGTVEGLIAELQRIADSLDALNIPHSEAACRAMPALGTVEEMELLRRAAATLSDAMRDGTMPACPGLECRAVTGWTDCFEFTNALADQAAAWAQSFGHPEPPPPDAHRTAAWSLRIVARMLWRSEFPRRTAPAPADDCQLGEYFEAKHGLTPSRLRKARVDGRLEGAEKRGGRWYYSVAHVRRVWPDAFDE